MASLSDAENAPRSITSSGAGTFDLPLIRQVVNRTPLRVLCAHGKPHFFSLIVTDVRAVCLLKHEPFLVASAVIELQFGAGPEFTLPNEFGRGGKGRTYCLDFFRQG